MKTKKLTVVLLLAIFVLINPFFNTDIVKAATTVNSETELQNAINGGETEITIGGSFSINTPIEINGKQI